MTSRKASRRTKGSPPAQRSKHRAPTQATRSRVLRYVTSAPRWVVVVVGLIGAAIAIFFLFFAPKSLTLCSSTSLQPVPIQSAGVSPVYHSYVVGFENRADVSCKIDHLYSLRAVAKSGEHSLDAYLPPNNQPRLLKAHQRVVMSLSLRVTTGMVQASCRPVQSSSLELSFDNKTHLKWPLKDTVCTGVGSLYVSAPVLVPLPKP